MKQTIFMTVVTFAGVFGALAIEPFIGVAVYYLFAVLRPQYLWQWALPADIGWSAFVAWATLAGTAWAVLRMTGGESAGPRFSAAHKTFFLFGAWISVTYLTALNQTVAWEWFVEYLKLFIMFGVAAVAVQRIGQVWSLYALATAALIYIAYEVNFLYLTAGRVDIYRSGYGGLDNNGAGLMLAMGVPLALHAWEATQRTWRWVFLGGVPLLLHAVLMSYSRGAMLSLLIATPLLLLRSHRRRQFGLALVLLLAALPVMAGQEIRGRFFSLERYATDSSANSRFESWGAAVRIANDYPVFGVGIRNSNLLSREYGADIEGRTIHSQYLQTLADAGYPGLALYLLALGTTWVAMMRTRRVLKTRSDADAQLALSMLSGLEGALLVFCVGASFLSLEVFELPYVVALCGVQISLLMRVRTAAVSEAGTSLAPAAPVHPHALWPRTS